MLFEHFWIQRGPQDLPAMGREDDGGQRRFVATASVRQHLCNLARAVLVRKHPILLQVSGRVRPGQTRWWWSQEVAGCPGCGLQAAWLLLQFRSCRPEHALLSLNQIVCPGMRTLAVAV